MIIAIMIGRKGSRGFPGKNTYKVLGRALCEYPLIAAKKSKYIDKIYVSTDCDKIKKISSKYNVEFIKGSTYYTQMLSQLNQKIYFFLTMIFLCQ